jgi:nickel transport protein
MMKSFVRWSATLGIVGSAVVGSSLIGNLRALALPQAQVIQKLQSVPVFTIMNPKDNTALVLSVDNKDKKGATGVFMSQRDAQAFYERLKKDNPDLAKTMQVVPLPLGDVYQAEQANKGKPDSPDIAYVPVRQQVDSAVELLRRGGQQIQQFNAVPLFYATADKGKGYLTVKNGNQEVVPVFFDKEQLQTWVDGYKKQQPNQAATVEIQVASLQDVMQKLAASNDPFMTKIEFYPSREAIEILKSLPSAPAQNQSQPQPQRR